jgi:hypothetical protein
MKEGPPRIFIYFSHFFNGRKPNVRETPRIQGMAQPVKYRRIGKIPTKGCLHGFGIKFSLFC